MRNGETTVLRGEHPALGKLFAAVDSDARFIEPKVQELRFACLLSPFRDEEAARAALQAAGATNITGDRK